VVVADQQLAHWPFTIPVLSLADLRLAQMTAITGVRELAARRIEKAANHRFIQSRLKTARSKRSALRTALGSGAVQFNWEPLLFPISRLCGRLSRRAGWGMQRVLGQGRTLQFRRLKFMNQK
jgi:hypothetical protein